MRRFELLKNLLPVHLTGHLSHDNNALWFIRSKHRLSELIVPVGRHSNRCGWRPVELWDSVYVRPAEAVHPLQPAQHVRTDRGLCHTQVRPSQNVCF